MSKAIKTTLPTFELFSVFGNDVKKIRNLTIDEAVKLSPKKLFKGMLAKPYHIDTDFGSVCLDLTSWRKPKLYTNTIHDIKGIIRSPKSININEILTTIQKKFPKMFSEIHGDEHVQNIQLRFNQLPILKAELSRLVDEAVRIEKLILKPVNYVDGLCNRSIDHRLLDEIIELEPFGDNFPEPTFFISARIDKIFATEGNSQYRITCENSNESLILTHCSDILKCKLMSGDDIEAVVKVRANIDGKAGVSLLAISISKI